LLSLMLPPVLILQESRIQGGPIFGGQARSSCTYTPDDAEEKKARSRLNRFALYTDNIRTLLNVADRVLQSILQSTLDPTEKRNVERDFDYLLVDSIRLNYIKDLVRPVSLDCNSASS